MDCFKIFICNSQDLFRKMGRCYPGILNYMKSKYICRIPRKATLINKLTLLCFGQCPQQ